MEMNLQMILISWFRKNKSLVDQLVPFEDAIEVCGRRAIGETVSLLPAGTMLAAEPQANYEQAG